MSDQTRNRLLLGFIVVLAIILLIVLALVLFSNDDNNGDNPDSTDVADVPTQVILPTDGVIDPTVTPAPVQDGVPTNTPPDGPNDGDQIVAAQNTPPTSIPEPTLPEGVSPDVATFESELNEVLEPTETPFELPTQTLVDEDALPVPGPRTLVASVTEEPEPGAMFDYIRFELMDSEENILSTTEIFGDGRAARDQRQGTITAEKQLEINEAITTLNFFGMQGNLISSTRQDDEYLYRLSIQRGGQERAVFAQDGYIPAELVQLMSLVRAVGDQVAMGR